jgi:hypothetical protein
MIKIKIRVKRARRKRKSMCHDVLTAIRPLWDGMKRNKSKWALLSSCLVSHSSWKKRINGLLDGRRDRKGEEKCIVHTT